MAGKWSRLIKEVFPKEDSKKRPKLSKPQKLRLEDIGFSRLVIIFLAGVFLLILSLPSGTLSAKKDTANRQRQQGEEEQEGIQDAALDAMSKYAARQEEQLESVLSKVDGVGKVDVMLTIASSEEKKTLNKENVSQDSTKESDSTGGRRNQNSSSSQTDPVLIGQGDGQTPYVVQIQSPQIEGVVVVAQGAGSGVVDAEIIAAVEALFPIETHKIKVMKMEK